MFLLRFTNADPKGWTVNFAGWHISYRGVEKYRYDGHPFVFGWPTSFVAFGGWSRWGSSPMPIEKGDPSEPPPSDQ